MQRKYDFKNGTVMDAEQVDAELNQLISGINTLESADAAIKAAAQMKKITNDSGGVKLSASSTSDDILQMILNAGVGVHTFYATFGSKNLPDSKRTFRGIADVTSPGVAFVYGITNDNKFWTNHCESNTWKEWRGYTPYGGALWDGSALLASTTTITPTKKLSQCVNGWILVWSDFDPGIGPNNFDFHYSYIPKFISMMHNGGSHLFSIPRSPDTVIVKNVNVFDDKIVGKAENITPPTDDVALRYVLEW